MQEASSLPPTRRSRTQRLPRAVRWGSLAVLAALGLRACVGEPYRIPSGSMERTLLPGDYVLAEKLSYGARLPVSLGLPLTGLYAPGLTWPALRLPGARGLRRGDVVLFNAPWERGPIDRRTVQIKRLVGLPGDRVSIDAKAVSVNGRTLPLPPGALVRWRAFGRVPVRDVKQFGGDVHDAVLGEVTFSATEDAARRVGALPGVIFVEPVVAPRVTAATGAFPEGSGNTPDHVGALRVPRRGDTLRLDLDTWPLYRDLLRRHERRAARLLPGGRVEIDGAVRARYVVRQSYLYVLGDARDNSADSRTWGFVPLDHVVGRAAFVYHSAEPETHFIRWARIGRAVR